MHEQRYLARRRRALERCGGHPDHHAAAVEGRQHVTHSQSAGHRVELIATFHQPGGGRRVEVGPQGDHHDVGVKGAGVGLDPPLAGVDRPDRGLHEPYSGLDQVAVGVDHRVGDKPAEHHIEPREAKGESLGLVDEHDLDGVAEFVGQPCGQLETTKTGT